jgi:hypothetical protein
MIYVTDEVRDWIGSLDDASHRLVVQAIQECDFTVRCTVRNWH